MFFHLLLDERDGFSGDVAAVVVEALELSEEREDGVADSAAQFVIVFAFLFVLKVLFEESDFGHLPLEIGSIFEEIAFMEFIEFIPDLMSTIGHGLVLLFCDLCLIFAELLLCGEDHLRCELIEDDVLFGSSILIEL